MMLPALTIDHTEEHPLSALVSSLDQIVTGSEDDFLALGMNLQKVQMMSTAQRQKIAAAMGLFEAGENDGILQQISNYVQSSQQDTQSSQETAVNLCANLGAMLKLMDSIAQKSCALERAGLFLHVIGVNTGIECARYSQMEATFKVVSRDTVALAAQINNATDILIDQTAQATAEQEKTLLGAQQSIDSLKLLSLDSKQTTETAVHKVAELIDYSISMVNEAERMAVNISAEINRVVMGIQFHDNLRQRIEHVNEALLETEALREDSTEVVVCEVYLAVELQIAQLDNLVAELEALYQTQMLALSNIVEAISGLESRLGSMASEQSLEASRENPVAILFEGITTLEHLNSESLALSGEIRSSAERAEQIANDMQVAIKATFTIANNVKINALNAIIKAAKFGRSGEALQVLAQGMVSVSEDTRQMVTVFNDLLEQLSYLAHSEVTADPEQKKLEAGDDFDSTQVQQVFNCFSEELQLTHNDCESLTQNLEREQKQLVFIANLKDEIQQHASHLGSYAESICPQNEELLASMRSNFGDQLKSRYTMHEERVVHTELNQGKTLTPVPQQSTSIVSDDCLLFDQPAPASPATETELWGDDQAAPASAAVELFVDTPEEQPPADSENVELWGKAQTETAGEIELFDQPPAETVSATNEHQDEPADNVEKDEDNDTEEDFGDNVDLF